MANKFQCRYGVDDGFVSGGRSHAFTVNEDEIEGMDESLLADYFDDCMQEVFEQKISPYSINKDEFIAWGKETLKAQSTGDSHERE